MATISFHSITFDYAAVFKKMLSASATRSHLRDDTFRSTMVLLVLLPKSPPTQLVQSSPPAPGPLSPNLCGLPLPLLVVQAPPSSYRWSALWKLYSCYSSECLAASQRPLSATAQYVLCTNFVYITLPTGNDDCLQKIC